jgi:hypothetical protein
MCCPRWALPDVATAPDPAVDCDLAHAVANASRRQGGRINGQRTMSPPRIGEIGFLEVGEELCGSLRSPSAGPAGVEPPTLSTVRKDDRERVRQLLCLSSEIEDLRIGRALEHALTPVEWRMIESPGAEHLVGLHS